MNREATAPKNFDQDRPVLFLDIDGCLNNEKMMTRLMNADPGRIDCSGVFDFKSINTLNQIVERMNPYVILASSWRVLYDLPDVEHRMRLQGYTGSLDGKTIDKLVIDKLNDPPDYEMAKYRDRVSNGWWSHRGDEIQHWRDVFGHKGPVAIIDDDADMAGLCHRLIQTNFEDGLGPEHLVPVCNMLRLPCP